MCMRNNRNVSITFFVCELGMPNRSVALSAPSPRTQVRSEQSVGRWIDRWVDRCIVQARAQAMPCEEVQQKRCVVRLVLRRKKKAAEAGEAAEPFQPRQPVQPGQQAQPCQQQQQPAAADGTRPDPRRFYPGGLGAAAGAAGAALLQP